MKKMMKLILKFFLLIAVFLCGMMYGVRQFGGGADQALKDNLTIQTEEPDDNLPRGEVIDKKGEDGGKVQASNGYSQLGNAFSKAVTGMFRGVVTTASSILQHLMPDPSTRSQT